MKKIFYLFIVSGLLVSACKKSSNNNSTNNNNSTGPSKTGSTLDLIRDSIYLYASEDYLWNTALPSYATFNPRSFSNPDDLTALQNEVNAISQYAINPATGKPYEYYSPNPGKAKYSFIDNGSVSAALNGVKGDFGFGLEYNSVTDLRVEYVYPGSPAALAGIKRGYAITSINGSTSISYDAPPYGSGTSANLNYVNNAIFNSGSVTLILKKPDGTSVTVNLSTASYTVNPVLKDTVYNLGNGHKLGYIVFNSFTSDANADPQLNAAFTYFTNQGITDLAVDLRYNGGGYVSTAEHLDNLIVPQAKSGSLMYSSYFNSNLASGNDPLLGNQWRAGPPAYNYAQFNYSVAANAVNFNKYGSLNVNRVFFIITGQTASASELTINNLRPEMDVQFVGETSYGKPVGFFNININKYQMYIPEFSTKNSATQGDYYSGFTPGAAGYPGVQDYDDPTKDFGDPSEVLLGHILKYINTGSYSVQNPSTTGIPISGRNLSLAGLHTSLVNMNPHNFTGMVFNKKLNFKKR